MARVIKFAIDETDEHDLDGKRNRHPRHFSAIVDQQEGAVTAILAHDDCPKKGDQHPEFPLSLCKRIRIRQDEDIPTLYRIEAEYDSDFDYTPNPLDEPAKIRWGTSEFRRIATVDHEGEPLVTTAGGLIEDIEDERSHWVIDIQRNVSQVPLWLLDYGEVQPVNKDAVVIRGVRFKPRQLKLARIEIDDETDRDGVVYYPLRLQLVCNSQTWDREYLNKDLYELVLLDNYGREQPALPNPRPDGWRLERRPCRDANGEPVRDPQFLNKLGRRPRLATGPVTPNQSNLIPDYADGPIKLPLDKDDIVTLKFRIKAELPFRVLPLR